MKPVAAKIAAFTFLVFFYCLGYIPLAARTNISAYAAGEIIYYVDNHRRRNIPPVAFPPLLHVRRSLVNWAVASNISADVLARWGSLDGDGAMGLEYRSGECPPTARTTIPPFRSSLPEVIFHTKTLLIKRQAECNQQVLWWVPPSHAEPSIPPTIHNNVPECQLEENSRGLVSKLHFSPVGDSMFPNRQLEAAPGGTQNGDGVFRIWVSRVL
ncbi:hypothetical protein BDP27DRAFT_1427715 [Rhodocollybia butyracea]|uniref:Uncharacterized protein n=1 Tax=Rhodocollybia butyracea TaxID=206335 RepID=A0A9P5U2H8_9AGAR|nr:hypothetical protein BDP27DRAFT_1427715 [Rhodocollybia butyracea]